MKPRMKMSDECKHAQHRNCASDECWCACHGVKEGPWWEQGRRQARADVRAIGWRERMERAEEACRKARMVIGSDLRLMCLQGETDRECLNRCTREAIEALDAVIGSATEAAPEHSDATHRSEAQ